MYKLNVYPDTCVMSMLNQNDGTGRMEDTIKLWDLFVQGYYKVFISDITLEELEKCEEPKRSFIFNKLNEINFVTVVLNNKSKHLAKQYIELGKFPKQCEMDAKHMAIASVSNCHVITSWNCSHIVKVSTMEMIKWVNYKEGYTVPLIVTPTSLLEEGD